MVPNHEFSLASVADIRQRSLVFSLMKFEAEIMKLLRELVHSDRERRVRKAEKEYGNTCMNTYLDGEEGTRMYKDHQKRIRAIRRGKA
jgi:DNA repair photolyase